MIFNWYKLPISLPQFLETGLTSREAVVLLEGIGRTTLLISRGNLVSITYAGVTLPVNYEGINPYKAEGYAAFLDPDQNIWFGIEVPE